MQRRWALTEADLGKVPDEQLVQKVVDSVLDFVGELSPGEDDYELIRQTPKPAQFFRAMRLMESEVNNGGFEQYFWNSSCTLADVALEAYQAIGAPKYVVFLRRALDLAGNVRGGTDGAVSAQIGQRTKKRALAKWMPSTTSSMQQTAVIRTQGVETWICTIRKSITSVRMRGRSLASETRLEQKAPAELALGRTAEGGCPYMVCLGFGNNT